MFCLHSHIHPDIHSTLLSTVTSTHTFKWNFKIPTDSLDVHVLLFHHNSKYPHLLSSSNIFYSSTSFHLLHEHINYSFVSTDGADDWSVIFTIYSSSNIQRRNLNNKLNNHYIFRVRSSSEAPITVYTVKLRTKISRYG